KTRPSWKRRATRASRRAARRARPESGAVADAPPKEDQVPQAPPWAPRRRVEGTDLGAVRRLRPEVARGRLADEPSDRGRPNRDDAQDQARRQGLDQRLPGQAGYAEAGRDANGVRQGLPRALGRGREAWPRDVRAGGRPRAARQGGTAAGREQAAC